jgi:hypothetical protein
MWSVFMGTALVEAPPLAVALAGIILVSTRLSSRTHGSALFWSIAGFTIIAIRCVVDPVGRTRMTMAAASGIRPQQMAVEAAAWALGAQFLLLAALACLLIATLSNRKPA